MRISEEKKQQKLDKKVKELNSGLTQSVKFKDELEENKNTFLELFKNVGTLRVRDVVNRNNESMKFCIMFLDGLVKGDVVNQHVVKPLLEAGDIKNDENFSSSLINQLVFVNRIQQTDNAEDIIESITYGDTLLLVDGLSCGFILDTKGFTLRSIAEPEGENVLNGPKEGFNEGIMMNLSMLYRKLRTNEFKTEFTKVGRRTKTNVCICYIESLVDKKVLKEVQRRISLIDIDGVLDTNYISEFIRDKKYSPYKTVGFTERPDVVAGKLLEGRIAIIMDGTPVVLTAPYLFIENFQSNEDYYLNFLYTTFARILRIMGYFLTVLTPAIYISIIAYQIEILPPALTINIASAQQNVPLPAALEAVIMLIIFDLLKETGVRMPSSVGQTLSIVGALVIGQAAVEAKFVSAPLIIVVAFTGLTNLLTPRLNTSAFMYKYIFLIFAGVLGFFGVIICLSMFIIQIINLTSFGVPQIRLTGGMKLQQIKDIIIRAPWTSMKTRPENLSDNYTRMIRKE